MSIPVEVFDEGLIEHLAKQWEIDERAESFYVDTERGVQAEVNEDVHDYIQELPKQATKRYRTITKAFDVVSSSLVIDDDVAEDNLFNVLIELYEANKLSL